MTASRGTELSRPVAAAVFLGSVSLGVWLTRASLPQLASAELIWKIFGPLCVVVTTLSVLGHGSERAWVLPPPFMIWLVSASQRSSFTHWSVVFLGHVTVIVVLFACWRQNRRVAMCAVIACGVVTVWSGF